MFSVLGGPEKNEEDIDWLNDLKLFIDDNNIILTKIMMPAIEMHKQHPDHPAAHKLYIKPLNRCADLYCKKFEIKDAVEDLFDVKVSKVRTQNRLGKPRRYRFRWGRTKAWKKAMVTLNKEHNIEFF